MCDQTEQSFCGLSAALAGYDFKVGDGEDDSDCCVWTPSGAGSPAAPTEQADQQTQGRPRPAVTTASDIEQNLHYRKRLLLRMTVDHPVSEMRPPQKLGCVTAVTVTTVMATVIQEPPESIQRPL